LRYLDLVAFVLFASFYLCFQYVSVFLDDIYKLNNIPSP